MPNPFSRRLEYSYLEDLQGTVDDHELVCQILAGDWTAPQQESGIAVPRYLERLDSELTETLETTNHDLRVTHFDKLKEDNRYPIMGSALATRMIESTDIHEIRSLYENRITNRDGLLPAIFAQVLISNIVVDKPEKAIDNLAKLTPSEGHLIPIIRTAIDINVYKAAKRAASLERAKQKLAYASSDASMAAMNSALDLRVLRSAKRAEQRNNGEATELIREFASSDLASQALLECMEEGSQDASDHPRRRGRYVPRIPPKSRAALRDGRYKARQKKQQQNLMHTLERVHQDEGFLTEELIKATISAMALLGSEVSREAVYTQIHATAHHILLNHYDDDAL